MWILKNEEFVELDDRNKRKTRVRKEDEADQKLLNRWLKNQQK